MLIVKMICLAIGTVLAVLFILLTMRGKKEDWRIEGVPEKEFSDKELWAAGFAMQQMPMFRWIRQWAKDDIGLGYPAS